MNKYKYFLCSTFGILLLLTACDKEYDTVFDQVPDQRVREALGEYNDMLTGAPHGWMAQLTTGIDRKYFYYFDFNNNGEVVTVSDFNETTAGTPTTSSWMLKALQKPTLSFNTYSYIHLPADPQGQVNGGHDGTGLISDFEFSFEETSGDSVVLKGIMRGADLTFRRATEQEASAVLDGQVLRVLDGTKAFITANKGIELILPDHSRLPLVIDVQHRWFGAQYLADNDSLKMFRCDFTFSIDGIELKTPFRISGYSISRLTWNEEEQAYFVDLEGTTEITGYTDPFIFEATPPVHTLIGSEYPYVLIPEGSGTHPLPGQSEDFIAAYHTVADSLWASDYRLKIKDIELFFSPGDETMEFHIFISQPNAAGGESLFLAQYIYNYTVDEHGVYKFNFQNADENGWLIYNDMYPVLFNIESDHFKSEYIGGDLNLIGGFFSQENPGFYFSGYLLNK